MISALGKQARMAVVLWTALAAQAAPFTTSADGTEVTDHGTGLIWRRCMEGRSGANCSGGSEIIRSHEAALAHAQSQRPWRLPSVKELATLVDRRHRDPAIDQTVFPIPYREHWFWTSTPTVDYAGLAWTIDFGTGMLLKAPRKVAFHVRLVRSAPDPDGLRLSPTPRVVNSTFVATAPARLEVNFSRPMEPTHIATGDGVPSSSVWASPTLFVVTFSSFTPGGTFTLKAPTAADASGFRSSAGVGLAQDHVFPFPTAPQPEAVAPTVTRVNFVAAVPARLEVDFDQPMGPGYGTPGEHSPASSVWETPTRFVITFDSFTPGGYITLLARYFVSAGGTAMASNVIFRFPGP